MADLSFGQAIQTMRLASGMTQTEVAERARLSRGTLMRVERGHMPRQQRYSRLVNAFGFTLGHDLITAAIAERKKLLGGARTVFARCESCDTPIPPRGARRGRPRKRCTSCAGDRAELARVWRAANPDRVAAYNAARRQEQEGKVTR